jgi:hypothetical protein
MREDDAHAHEIRRDERARGCAHDVLRVRHVQHQFHPPASLCTHHDEIGLVCRSALQDGLVRAVDRHDLVDDAPRL